MPILSAPAAQGKHWCQRVHLPGGVQIGPDAYIDDGIGDSDQRRHDNTEGRAVA